MAKKAKKRQSKYSKGWETRRANAARLGISPHQFRDTTKAELTKLTTATQPATTANGESFSVDPTNLLVEELMSLARSKGGAEKIAAKLRVIEADARFKGQSEVEESAVRRLKDVQERMAERVVCAFIAEVNMAERLHSGLPPDQVWAMSSLTVRHVVDALNRAGYRAKGRDNHGAAAERREALMGKGHADVHQPTRSIGSFG